MSPEYRLHPHEIHAPVDQPGASSAGLPQQEKSPQHPSEPSLQPPQFAPDVPFDISVSVGERVSSEGNQDEVHAVGQAAQSLSIRPEPPTDQPEEQAQGTVGTIDLASARTQQEQSTISREEKRRQEALELGLPEDADDDEIRLRRDMITRKEISTELKWGLAPELAAKMERLGDDPYPAWEHILYHALNVSGPKAKQLSSDEIAKRIKLARKMFRQMEKDQEQEASTRARPSSD